MSQAASDDPTPSAQSSVGDAGRVHPASGSTDEPVLPNETGGPKGPEPTRYGDWEKAGRCIDF